LSRASRAERKLVQARRSFVGAFERVFDQSPRPLRVGDASLEFRDLALGRTMLVFYDAMRASEGDHR
jgi:hypothetical protein